MAYDFYEKTEFKAPIIDIYLMGSSANYNWSPESDVDVHIIIDYDKLQMPPETAGKAVKTAGGQWNMEHQVAVKGHKVEINFQNAKEVKPHVTGIYSLVKDQWIRKPVQQNIQVDKPTIQAKYAGMKKYVESALRSGNRETMKSVKKYLDAFRQYGLDTHGELSMENIVFKILRSKGLIKALKDAITATYDKEMSVKEGSEFFYPPEARFGLGAIGANDDVQFKEFSRDTFADQPHGRGGNPMGRRRFRYMGGTVEWSDCGIPDKEQKQLVNNYLIHRGFPVTKHTSIYDKFDGFNLPVDEVSQKDLKQTIPTRPSQYKYTDNGDLRLDKMNLDNLSALRAKVARSIAYLRKQPEHNPHEMAREVAEFKRISAEIKCRLEYINAPVEEGYGAGRPEDDRLHIPGNRWQIRSKDAPKTPKMEKETVMVSESITEAVDPKHLYIGYVQPSLEIKVMRADALPSGEDSHGYLVRIDHSIDPGRDTSWRYREDLNTLYWWETPPDEDRRKAVEGWVQKKLGKSNPQHKILDPKDVLGFTVKNSTIQQSHGMSEVA